MLYLKKLGLVTLLMLMSLLWLPLLAVRGLLAAFVLAGRKLYAGLSHKDSGVKIACCAGVLLVGLPWLLAAGVMLALASYEIVCFKVMDALFRSEDIGYRPSGADPQGPRPEARREAPVFKLPSANSMLTQPQAMAASKACGWCPPDAGYKWSSQHQCWYNDEEAVAINGERVGWIKNGEIRQSA